MPSRIENEIIIGESQTPTIIANQESQAAVIVTHPWGPLGGNMHNNVVVAACLYFQKIGLTTARFDFHSGFGRGYSQVQQVQEVASELKQQCGARLILLVGYSYGSLISGSTSADISDCLASIMIAPPFSVAHWLLMFNSSHHLTRSGEKSSLPRLLIIGTEDNFTTELVFRRTIEEHFPDATGAVIKDADHFFRHREKDVMDVIGQWLLETFPQCEGDLRRLRDCFFT